MNRRAHNILKHARAALLLLFLAPFLALQTVAQGTMPSSGADGFTMVLCTGDAAVQVVMLDDGTIRPVEDDHAGLSCPWAISHLPTVEPDVPAFPAFTAFDARADHGPVPAPVTVSHVAPIPPARAPPATA